ncbi:hypothetical protein CBS101457_002064 [Exobasidium rhododendri]|nr:hypothetical protein CBS101457_002064 [Exobasidium rhododendri]
MSLAILPAAMLALSAATYKLAWYDKDGTFSMRPLMDVCLQNSAGWFQKSKTSSSFYPQLNDVLCARIAFLDQLFSSRAGCGSSLQGLILPALVLLLTSSSILLLGSGLGVFIPPFVGALYVIGGSITKKSTVPVSLPAATRAVYGANLSTILTCIFFIIQYSTGGGVDSSSVGEEWWRSYISKEVVSILKMGSGIFADTFPLLVSIPLVALGLNDVQRPKNEKSAIKYLKENYLAAEVAYGFERTWAYYRQAGLLASIAYAYGLSRIVRDVLTLENPFSPSTKYLLLITLNLALLQVTVPVTDAQTTSPDALDEEAAKAIARAPAGNPGVDDNPRVYAIMLLLVGPSLPCMLWAAKGEEVRGYKGRRAWRVATADEKLIK